MCLYIFLKSSGINDLYTVKNSMSVLAVLWPLTIIFSIWSSGVKDGLSRKDEMFNDVIQLLAQNNQKFSNPEIEGKYVVQV